MNGRCVRCVFYSRHAFPFLMKPSTANVCAWPSLDCCVSRGDMVAADGHVVHACHGGNVWTVDTLWLHACLLAHAASPSPPLQGLYNREWNVGCGRWRLDVEGSRERKWRIFDDVSFSVVTRQFVSACTRFLRIHLFLLADLVLSLFCFLKKKGYKWKFLTFSFLTSFRHTLVFFP